MVENITDKLSFIRQININEYDYALPDERIAKFPLRERDLSKLLVYRNGEVTESIFNRLPELLPEKSLIVFNDTRVIRARLIFTKETGAQIEIFCLEPEAPCDYALNFQSREQCRWTCFVGNSKRWKGTLKRTIRSENVEVVLTAERLGTVGQTHSVLFKWDNPTCTFADILDVVGILPIPPYLHRKTEKSDMQTYQTVYSKINGSVAAPTAGLHFTPEVLNALDISGFKREELTLHVGAGTFKPVQTETIGEHEMHGEYIAVNRSTVASLIDYAGQITAVGTTSLRTLESLYYIGATLAVYPDASPDKLIIKQWTPYENKLPQPTTEQALSFILKYLDDNKLEKLISETQIMIVPGYKFRIVNNLITNFHQPKSTLLLLVSAFVKGDWKKIYDYALHHNFRFLSYGDSSLLFGN